jgi:hypothetical protein
VKVRSRLSREYPGRGKPREGTSSHRVKRPADCQGLPEGLKPSNRPLSGRPGASAAGIPLGGNGRWVHPGGNALETFRKGKPSKGESQERCRCETKPARARREETVKRVVKP